MNVITAENDPSQRCLGGLSGILAAANVSKEHPVAAAIEGQLAALLAAVDLQSVMLRVARPLEGLPSEMLRTAGPSGRLREVTLPLGVDGELGSLTVGATREVFPDATDRMLLEVAALKAANALL